MVCGIAEAINGARSLAAMLQFEGLAAAGDQEAAGNEGPALYGRGGARSLGHAN